MAGRLHLSTQSGATTTAQGVARSGCDSSTYIALGTRQTRLVVALLSPTRGAARVERHGVVAKPAQSTSAYGTRFIGCSASWQRHLMMLLLLLLLHLVVVLLQLLLLLLVVQLCSKMTLLRGNGLEAFIERGGTLAVTLGGHSINSTAATRIKASRLHGRSTG